MAQTSGVNPFAVIPTTPIEGGVHGDHCRRVAGSFLYRVIEVAHPLEFEFVYSAWWFRQTIDIGSRRVWHRISWLWIHNKAKFSLPAQIDPRERSGEMKIDFSRGLRIRRFRIWIEEELIYDEVSD
ncbi:MAG: hypothetical protein AAFU85_13910 [Planctomycetota bacterium]